MTHFPGSTDTPTAPSKYLDDDIYVDIEDPSVSWLTEEMVKTAIDAFAPYKSPGPDNIPPCVWQHLGPLAIKRLTKIIKACLLLGVVPDEWLLVRVIFIPKPGKDNYDDPRSFRPLSLMQFIYKIVERVRYWRHDHVTLRINPIHEHQHGFRKGYSCSTSLSQFQEEIELAFIKN